MTWFKLTGDERINQRCTTEDCGGQVTERLEANGVGSNYCSGCRAKIEMSEAPPPGITPEFMAAQEIVSAWLGPDGDKYVSHIGSHEACDLMRRIASALQLDMSAPHPVKQDIMAHDQKIGPARTCSDAIQWLRDYWDGKDGAIETETMRKATRGLLVPVGTSSLDVMADAGTVIVEVEELIPPHWYVVTRGGHAS